MTPCLSLSAPADRFAHRELPLVRRLSGAARSAAGVLALITLAGVPVLRAADTLPGTQPLTGDADLSVAMVRGIDRFLDDQLARTVRNRGAFWQADFSSRAAYERSLAPNRQRLARMIGLVDKRVANPEMEYVGAVGAPALVAESDRFTAHAVRWRVLDGVHGEGLLLQPKGPVVARVVAVPDAAQWPELLAGLRPGLSPDSQYARRLAENGCEVFVPVLLDRTDRFSRNPRINAVANVPHREFIYLQAYVLGRHVIGYEVQKLLGAIDWFVRRNEGGRVPVGVAGWGEGGLLALHAAALDTRIDAALVSGYFGPREALWAEPLYRNVFGLLREFGDAELAGLIAPRPLVVEPAESPLLGEPTRRGALRERDVAATGRLSTPALADVRAEAARASRLAGPFGNAIRVLDVPARGLEPLGGTALRAWWEVLLSAPADWREPGAAPVARRPDFDEAERQERQVRELEGHVRRGITLSAAERDAFLWQKVPPTTPEAWREAMRPYRETFWKDHIGRFERPGIPLNPRARLIHDRPAWSVHEVVLDAYPHVQAWGYYFLPKGIKPGERRPVVVVQHGGGGLPADVMDEDPASEGWRFYKAFAARLVERGFIVFAPHMLNGGHDRLLNRPNTKLLQRKANALGGTITSVAIGQQDAILDWLGTQPAVDPARIAYYGLSYGGKAAMRIPAILDRFALSICSADFTEWIWKNATTDFGAVPAFRSGFDVQEFGLGSTFGYAEMAALIAPRSFMVERGHNDGVSPDEWVAFEYAKVRRLYARLKIPEATAIEFFDGPHTIHGVGTFAFLHRQLGWPEPAGQR